MDRQRFDNWTRSLSSCSTRRTFSKLLAGGTLGALLAAVGREDGEAKKCVAPGKKCKGKNGKKQKCCGSAKCRGKKCQCPRGSQPCGKKCCAVGDEQQCPSGRERCGATCCELGQTCLDGTCRPCDVCANGCAFTSVQVAVNAASAGATIRVCPGTYPTANVVIDKNLALVGAGAERTRLDGGGTARVLNIATGRTVLVQGLTVTGGAAVLGGGIVNLGSLTLDGSTVTGNRATQGGGINNGGTLTLIGSRVTGNEAQRGGGIVNVMATTIGAGSRVSGNTATDGPGTGGGIITGVGAATTITTGAIVKDNTPDDCAGPGMLNGTCPTP